MKLSGNESIENKCIETTINSAITFCIDFTAETDKNLLPL